MRRCVCAVARAYARPLLSSRALLCWQQLQPSRHSSLVHVQVRGHGSHGVLGDRVLLPPLRWWRAHTQAGLSASLAGRGGEGGPARVRGAVWVVLLVG